MSTPSEQGCSDNGNSESFMISSRYWQDDKKEWFVTASYRYCGYISTNSAESDGDIAAKIDSVNDVKQHIISCDKNPNKIESDMDKFMSRIFEND